MANNDKELKVVEESWLVVTWKKVVVRGAWRDNFRANVAVCIICERKGGKPSIRMALCDVVYSSGVE